MSIWPDGAFRNARVLITGGTSGIGAGIAKAYLTEGARVCVTGVTAAEADAARDAMPGVEARVLDVADAGAVADLVAGLDDLAHVVNCAGVIRRHEELDPEVFAQVVDINLNGTMRVCAPARPSLAARGGTILNTASMLSFFGGGLGRIDGSDRPLQDAGAGVDAGLVRQARDQRHLAHTRPADVAE